ncbi:hypothetical protein [Bordetella muralis]|uniref:hypothetical protein n=1 Tax=Bordetella muralis TaxID=1649130 RepID=UPI0039EED754
MILFNDEMRRRASRELLNLVRYPQLPIGLSQIIQSGFSKKNGCYFFENYASKLEEMGPDMIRSRFGDLTGYEVSFNTIHIDDFSEELTLSIGLAFSREFLKSWAKWADVPCKLVVASNDGEFGEDTSFRFYVPREDEVYMDYSNISGFDEAIIAVDVLPGSDSNLLNLDRVRNVMAG